MIEQRAKKEMGVRTKKKKKKGKSALRWPKGEGENITRKAGQKAKIYGGGELPTRGGSLGDMCERKEAARPYTKRVREEESFGGSLTTERGGGG